MIDRPRRSLLLRSGAAACGVGLMRFDAVVNAADLPRWRASEAARHLDGRPAVLLMRHELTEPGIGDPPHFKLGDCSTQRNLSAQGRDRSRETGARLRAAGIHPERILSSRWCRCLETARLAFGQVEPWPALDSFFAQPGQADAQREQWLAGLERVQGGAPWMLVTHQVNISAFLGQWTAMGEIIVAQRLGTRWQPVARI
ncbi:MAG: hypothetical protein RL322_2382 [Pseudomonadota bacterium]